MIVVIADDLSGAAELAGIALRRGLSAEVQTVFFPATDAEVVCLDTNTRLLDDADAARRVAAVSRQVAELRPAWIFKKCDSVLRGSVLAEARAVAQAVGWHRLLILSANPSRDRIIRNGHCYIEGKPLHESLFADDPTHPRTTSDIRALLGSDLTGVSMPNAESMADVQREAESLAADTLPVGGADFFAALLQLRSPRHTPRAASLPQDGPTLMICGSTATWSQRQAEAQGADVPVFGAPYNLGTILRSFQSRGRILLGTAAIAAESAGAPQDLTTELARVVAAVIQQSRPPKIMIEGGATAAAILQALGWTRLTALHAVDDVAILHRAGTSGRAVFIKPGSYAWPRSLWPPAS